MLADAMRMCAGRLSAEIANLTYLLNYNKTMKPSATISYVVRLLALGYGGCVILVSVPLAFSAGTTPSEYQPPISPLLLIPAFACLLASGFLYVGVAGVRMARSRWQRLLAGSLLAVPLLWGARMLIHVDGLLIVGLVFLVPAVLTLEGAVWPWNLASWRDTPSDLPAEKV